MSTAAMKERLLKNAMIECNAGWLEYGNTSARGVREKFRHCQTNQPGRAWLPEQSQPRSARPLQVQSIKALNALPETIEKF